MLRRALLAAALLASPAYATTPWNVLGGSTYANISGAATSVLKSSQGVLERVCVNTPAAGTVTIYDNTSATGTKIGTITLTTSSLNSCLDYGATFRTGLTVVTSAAADITVTFQ